MYFFKSDILDDVTYSVELLIWTLVEPGVYLIAATLPSLRPIVRDVFEDVKLETIYNVLLNRYSRAFSVQKPSKTSAANMRFNSANPYTMTMTAGSGARSAGFFSLDDPKAQDSKDSSDGTRLGMQ